MGKTVVGDDGFFEWDEEKSNANQRKHGVTFEEASLVFLDHKRIEFYDVSHSMFEHRYITLGNASRSKVLLLVVSSTERAGRTRIISARRASKFEEGLYYEG